jgi:putative two-component system response regulator
MRRAAGHRHTVLVVDNAPDYLSATVCLLESYRCEVTTADSGLAALGLFAGGSRPCMMLLDLRMPAMDGWELWDRMHAHAELRLIPVVILSGELPDLVRARAVGLRDFVQKAGSTARVVAAVERYCHAPQVTQ